MIYDFQKNILNGVLIQRTWLIRYFALEIDNKAESNTLEDQNAQLFVKMAFKNGQNDIFTKNGNKFIGRNI
jgi:hypothetical protein